VEIGDFFDNSIDFEENTHYKTIPCAKNKQMKPLQIQQTLIQ